MCHLKEQNAAGAQLGRHQGAKAQKNNLCFRNEALTVHTHPCLLHPLVVLREAVQVPHSQDHAVVLGFELAVVLCQLVGALFEEVGALLLVAEVELILHQGHGAILHSRRKHSSFVVPGSVGLRLFHANST